MSGVYNIPLIMYRTLDLIQGSHLGANVNIVIATFASKLVAYEAAVKTVGEKKTKANCCLTFLEFDRESSNGLVLCCLLL